MFVNTAMADVEGRGRKIGRRPSPVPISVCNDSRGNSIGNDRTNGETAVKKSTRKNGAGNRTSV